MTRASCLRTAQGERIALVGGLRSPFARQASAYLGVPAVELGRQVVDELIWRTGVDPAVVDLLVFGQVIQMPAAMAQTEAPALLVVRKERGVAQ